MVTSIQTIEEAIRWINSRVATQPTEHDPSSKGFHCEHKKCPIQYVYLSSQIPNSYELFDQISIAPVQMVDNCNSSHITQEILDMYKFYKGRILVVDRKGPSTHTRKKEKQASYDIHWLIIGNSTY